MFTHLFYLLAFGLLILFWLDGARARELAVGIAKAACEKEGYQFLDDSVYLQRMAPRWTRKGLLFRRMYRFEYSIDRTLREKGYVLMMGSSLEAIHIKSRLTIEQEKET